MKNISSEGEKKKKKALQENSVPLVVSSSSSGSHSKFPLKLHNLTFHKVVIRCRCTVFTLVILTFANVDENKIFFRHKWPSVVS